MSQAALAAWRAETSLAGTESCALYTAAHDIRIKIFMDNIDIHDAASAEATEVEAAAKKTTHAEHDEQLRILVDTHRAELTAADAICIASKDSAKANFVQGTEETKQFCKLAFNRCNRISCRVEFETEKKKVRTEYMRRKSDLARTLFEGTQEADRDQRLARIASDIPLHTGTTRLTDILDACDCKIVLAKRAADVKAELDHISSNKRAKFVYDKAIRMQVESHTSRLVAADAEYDRACAN
jgi:hypothetical protein